MEKVSISKFREAPYRGFGGDIPEDVVYQSFYNTMDAGIIGEKEYITSLIRDEDYTNALAAVIAMTDTNLIEYNFKVVNEIYLDYLQSGADTLTSSQEATLMNIAYMPSLTHGEGVFMARGMLGIMVDVQVSSSARISNNEFSYPSWTKVRIWPNPATNEITVTFDKPLNEDERFTLYNQTGTVVFSHNLPKNKFQYVLNVENLNSGIYYGKLMSNGNYVFDKIVIVK
jgi:hypothetical protein